MPNIDEFFPSKYLKASDLKGREPVLTIAKVLYEPVGQGKQMKGVVYFDKVEKGLVLNKTNANRITQIAGSGITEEWRGVQIKLYTAQVEFQGAPVDAIRIRPPQASKANALRPSEVLPVAPSAQAPVTDAFADAAVETAREVLDDSDIPF
jgi:hypothetical protein